MPGVRGISEDLVVLASEDLTLAASGSSVTSTAIDTTGYDRGFMYAVELDDDVGVGSLAYKVELSDDGSTYTDAPDESYGPGWKQTTAERALEDCENGRQQPIGVSCGTKYAKLTITTTGTLTAETASVIAIMAAEYKPDASWTAEDVNPGDDLP